MVFFTTRVAKSNAEDWNKLIKFIPNLNKTVEDVKIIMVLSITDLLTWVDASYAVDANLHIHTRVLISTGYGMINC